MMLRSVIIWLLLVFAIFHVGGAVRKAVVADSLTRKPLPSASIFDRQGNFVGVSHTDGRLPFIPASNYPVTLRYVGFREKTVPDFDADTIFLQENAVELPEILVASNRHRVMHILGYVREYSTMTTYTDTVFLFREKMVDYMLTPDKKVRFKGWSSPRILACRSYYRFTNEYGLDSVSDVSHHHFSWSDWIGLAPVVKMPGTVRNMESGTDTLRGRYAPAEIWTKNDDRVMVDVDVLADTVCRKKWIPMLSGFFRDGLDFGNFRVRFVYDKTDGDCVSPLDLTGYSFDMESKGRGHEMFRFNRINEPFFVSTYAEVYIMDKEYITVKEAKKWERRRFSVDDIGIYEPMQAPELQPSIRELVDRVNNINQGTIRLAQAPDRRLVGRHTGGRNFKVGRRALSMLKQLTGITLLKSHRNFDNRWDKFRDEQKQKNDNRLQERLASEEP